MNQVNEIDRKRQSAWNARWDDSQKSELYEFLRIKFMARDKHTPVEVIQDYEQSLTSLKDLGQDESIFVDRLKAVWSGLQDPNRVTAQIPSVEALRQAYKSRVAAYNERVAQKQKSKQKAIPVGERAACLSAVHAAYAHRIFDNIGVKSPVVINQKYAGDFDVAAFVQSLPLPPKTFDRRAHDACYEELELQFKQAWSNYVA